jgi:hypothetical protein
MTRVELFAPSVEHGRPKLASFSGPEGELACHVSREDGSLWLFAHGPSGGDRGFVLVQVGEAHRLGAWLDDGPAGAFHASASRSSWLELAAGSVTVASISTRYNMKRWSLDLDDAAERQLRELLSAWIGVARAKA